MSTRLHPFKLPAGLMLPILVLGLLFTAAARAEVQARLSENPVYAGDTLVLTLSSDAAANGTQPDLSPLQRDFQILGTGTSSQLSIVNGRRSARTEWQVRLQPRRSGEIRIPPLQVGTEHSPELTLKVTDSPSPAAAGTRQHLFVETGVVPLDHDPYVQQQITYRVRLFYDDRVVQGELEDPQIADAVVERLGEDRRYTATRNGHAYQVIERRYAVFPQKSGMLEIPAVRFTGRLAGQGGQRGFPPRTSGLMQRFFQGSPFANDPFFNGGAFGNDPFDGFFGSPGREVRAFGPPLRVQVRPRPSVQGPWLPASDVRLHDSWADTPPQLHAGEPVSRTITLEADGLSGAQIPALELAAPAGVRVYREPAQSSTRTDDGRLTGVSRQTLTYIPAAGPLEIPAIKVDWWNTARDQAASTALPPWQLEVEPGTAGSTRAASPGPGAEVAPAPAVASVEPPPDLAEPAPAGWRDRLAAAWPWLLGGGVLLIIIGTGWWLWRRRRPMPDTTAIPAKAPPAATVPDRPAPDRSALQRAVETACRDRDAAAASRALLDLAALQLPPPAPLNLSALAARLARGAEAVRALERHLYGATAGDWPADELWAAVRDGLVEPGGAAGNPDPDELPPLYAKRA